jgi:hypothetical protein
VTRKISIINNVEECTDFQTPSDSFFKHLVFIRCFFLYQKTNKGEIQQKEGFLLTKYTQKTNIPHYEPTGKKPKISELINEEKAMNTFFCDVKKPFVFPGRMNEDVNMYVTYGNKGKLILTVADATIKQRDTQKAKGGMTDIYMQHGTYLKSFYSVICSPQCVKVADMNTNNRRIHHRINWKYCTPMIICDKYKKI